MNDFSGLDQVEHVPLPAPEVPKEMDTTTKNNEIYAAINKIVDSDGNVDLNSLSPEEGGVGDDVFVHGELPALHNPAMAKQVQAIAQNPTLTASQKQDAIYSLQRIESDEKSPAQRARQTLGAAEEAAAKDVHRRVATQVINDGIIAANRNKTVLAGIEDRLKLRHGEGGAANNIEAVLEFGSELLPILTAKSNNYDPAELIQRGFPELTVGIKDRFILSEETLAKAQNIFLRLPPPEQERRLLELEQHLNSIEGTFGSDNRHEARRLFQIISGITGGIKEFDAARVETTRSQTASLALNVLTLGVGGKIKSLGSGAIAATKGLVKGSPAQVISEAGPSASRGTIKAAAADATGETAEALGTSRPEILEEFVMMNGKDEPIRRGPDLVDEEVKSLADEIIKINASSGVISDDELKTAIDRMNAVKSPNAVELSKSSAWFDEDTGDIRGSYIFGPKDVDGTEFDSPAQAQEFIDKSLDTDWLDQDVMVLTYDPEVRRYVPFSPSGVVNRLDETPGKYVVQATYAKPAVASVDGSSAINDIGLKWFQDHLDTSVTFTKEKAAAITGVELRAAKVTTILTDVIKPYGKLKAVDQQDVSRLIKKGNEEGVSYTDDVLFQTFGNDMAKIEGYKAIRKFYDINHAVRNFDTRRQMKTEGWQEIRLSPEKATYLKPHTGARPTGAFDADTGKYRATKPGDDIMTVRGGYRYIDEAGEEANASFIITKPQNLKPLRADVLPKTPGYIGTHADAKWVVRQEKLGSNGEIVSTPKLFGSNIANLEEYVARHGDESYKIVRSREADDGISFLDGELDTITELNIAGHSKQRSDLFKLSDSYRASLLTPEEAIAKDIVAMGRHAGLGEISQYMTNKLTTNFKEFFPRGMHWGKLERPRGLDREGRARFREALTLHRRLKLMTGMEENTIAKGLKSRMLNVAHSFAHLAANPGGLKNAKKVSKVQTQFLRAMSRAFEVGSDVDLVAKLKHLNFIRFIVFNPIKQIVMQSLTSTLYTGVEGGVKYAASGKMASDLTFLLAAKGAGINDELFESVVKKHSQITGRSAAESKALFREFNDSGLLESISAHQFLEYADKNVIGRKFTLGTIPRKVTAISRSGFELGEAANLSSAYVIVRNREVERLGRSILTDKEARDVAIEAKQLAGNMGSANKALFQQGLLGVPFQFMSHNVRMLQFMIPKNRWMEGWDMPQISNRERARIAGVYSLFYGVGGFGVVNAWQDYRATEYPSLDPAINDFIEEGLLGMVMENTIESLSGDDADINVSQTFGALSGALGDFKAQDSSVSTPIGAIANTVMRVTMEGKLPPLDLALGASAGYLDDPTGVLSNAALLWNHPSFSTGEKFTLQAKALASTLPVFNNVFQARMAANMGVWVNSQGQPQMEASWSEALAKGVFGIQPAARERLFDLEADLRGRTELEKAPEEREINQSAVDAARAIRTFSQTLSENLITDEEFQTRMQAVNAAAGMAYGTQSQEYRLYLRSLDKEMKKIRTESGERLDEKLLKQLVNNKDDHIEFSYEKMLRRINSLPQSEQRDQVLKDIPNWFAGSKPE